MAGEERNIVCLIGDPKSPTGYKRISLAEVKECYNPDHSIVIRDINDKFVISFSSPVEFGHFTSTTVAFTSSDNALDFLRSLQEFAYAKGKEPVYLIDKTLSEFKFSALRDVIPAEVMAFYADNRKKKKVPIVEEADEDVKPKHVPFYMSNHNTFNIIDECNKLNGW